MSHDADKLIRQLSLVAFLMADRRALTARDIKSAVEGYSEMSDEAYARRFYSDRSELLALGIPLESQRDEFTGEELYTLRSEQYFLPALELSDEELAALQTALFRLEGQFAYAEPLRLALQNLALGRGAGRHEPRPESAVTVEFQDPDYSPEIAGRLTKLEAAISKQRTVKFHYWSIGRDAVSQRTLNPYALFSDSGAWYVVGLDLDRKSERTFRVSRIRGDITFATRRERDFRAPKDFDPAPYRGRPPWQVGDIVGEARVEVTADTAWWVARTHDGRGTLEDGVFTTPYADLGRLAAWVLRQDGRARPLDPPELIAEVERALQLSVDRHEGRRPRVAKAAPRAEEPALERPIGPIPAERFAVLQSLLAHLLVRCGDERRVVLPASELVEGFGIPYDLIDEHLQLLNLVNFGAGCYAVYAVLEGDDVRVDKELYGDAFRSAPRLTPLEARAIRLALEFVGPMLKPPGADTPLDRVRAKLEETFGQFELREVPKPTIGGEEEELIRALSEAIADHRVVEFEYLRPEDERPRARVVEPHSFERALPNWYLHGWDRDREAPRSFRLDRMRAASLSDERFDPRPDFVPSRLGDTLVAKVWFARRSARWRIERGAQPLADGAALEEMRVGSPDWLIGEILSFRGDAVVLEPEELRARVAERASELLAELAAPAKPKARARR